MLRLPDGGEWTTANLKLINVLILRATPAWPSVVAASPSRAPLCAVLARVEESGEGKLPLPYLGTCRSGAGHVALVHPS